MPNQTTWTDADAVSLRDFLGACPNFMRTLHARRPRVTSANEQVAESTPFINDPPTE
jgi:hypothetical protein